MASMISLSLSAESVFAAWPLHAPTDDIGRRQGDVLQQKQTHESSRTRTRKNTGKTLVFVVTAATTEMIRQWVRVCCVCATLRAKMVPSPIIYVLLSTKQAHVQKSKCRSVSYSKNKHNSNRLKLAMILLLFRASIWIHFIKYF